MTAHLVKRLSAALAIGSLGLASAAHADPFVGRLIGSVAAGMLVSGAVKSHDKKFAAQCRLYDREGMEVYLPCDSRRPIGELLLDRRPDAAPPPIEVAPLAAPAEPHHDGTTYAYASPPVQLDPCDCRDGHPRAHAGAAGSGSGGYALSGRASEVYEPYHESSVLNSTERYGGYVGYGFTGGVGGYEAFYPYGAVGYGAGGYRDGRAWVAGRDHNGFLTWAGKPVR